MNDLERLRCEDVLKLGVVTNFGKGVRPPIKVL